MPKYKVGDKVKVKDNLEHRSGYCMVGGRHSNSVVTEMLRLRGKIVTIEEAEDTGYRIHEDNGAWCWTDVCSTAPRIPRSIRLATRS